MKRLIVAALVVSSSAAYAQTPAGAPSFSSVTVQGQSSLNGNVTLGITANTLVDSWASIRFRKGLWATSPITLTAGTGITPNSASPAAFWQDIAWSGVSDTGAGTPNWIRFTDTVDARARVNALSLWYMEENYNTGAAGGRGLITMTFNKKFASGDGDEQFVPFAVRANFESSEGGTSAPGNHKGAYWLINNDIECKGDYLRHCYGEEFDFHIDDGTLHSGLAAILILHNGQADKGHGEVIDTSLVIDSSPVIAEGTGNRTTAISIGSAATSWPLDNALTSTSAVLQIQPYNYAALNAIITTAGVTTPQRYYAGWGVDFRIGNFFQAAWQSPGFKVDGGGQINAGASTITYGATGTTIQTPNVRTVSAIPHAGAAGTLYRVNDEISDPIGGLWLITATSAGGATALSQLKVGYGAACPAAGAAVIGGGGQNLTLDITCAATGTTTIGASAQTVSLDAATLLMANIPTSAPATHCALWANAGVVTRTTCP